MLRQLFYVSRASRALTDADLRDILSHSQRNNRLQDLTGCLLFSGTHFAQTLEGEAEAVGQRLDRIIHDPRHHDAVVLIDRQVPRRAYPDWSMAFLYKQDIADRLEVMMRPAPLSELEAQQLMAAMKADSVMGGL